MKKIKELIKISPYILPIIRFNFHYLPFHQAIYLPIFIYSPHLHVMKGTVKIETNRVRTGMIKVRKTMDVYEPAFGISLA